MSKRQDNISKGLRSVLGSYADVQKKNADPSAQHNAPKSPQTHIPLAHIHANPNQPRKDFAEKELEELSASIRQVGIITPITLRKTGQDTYEIISGERRYRAAQRAGLSEIPAYVRAADNAHDLLELALLENLQRADLNPMEIALSFQELIDTCDYTHEALAQKMSKDRSTVSNFLRLLKLPPLVQAALRDGTLSMGHARALAGLTNIDEQLHIFHEIIAGKLSVRAVEEIVKKQQTAPAPTEEKKSIQENTTKPVSETAQALSKVETKLRDHFNTRAQIVHDEKKSRGKIVIEYYSVGELNAILDKMGMVGE